jgi:anti-sigma B factor antagonist
MKIDIKNREGVTILAPKGKITIGKGDVALRDAVKEALGAGSKKILIDLAEVTTVDSSGIGELVSAHTSVANKEGQLSLMNLPSKVSDILQITQLFTVFNIFDSEDEAIGSFSRGV